MTVMYVTSSWADGYQNPVRYDLAGAPAAAISDFWTAYMDAIDDYFREHPWQWHLETPKAYPRQH